MSKIDPGLRFLADQRKPALRTLADEAAFTFEAETGEQPTATVLLQFDGDLSDIEEAGVEIRSVAGDVATGEVELRHIGDLEGLEAVKRVEISRVLGRELDLALPESRAGLVHTGPPGHRGTGVIVGIIDSGIDYTHEAFRRDDGTSRILAIWDQRLAPQGSESSPVGFSYGVEYRKSAIDNALTAADPFAVVRHRDLQIPGDGFHGTHVAGIAAGDGSAPGQGLPAFTFVGAAPEADLVVVANTRGRSAGERGLGDSADTLDAVRYVFDLAASLGRPAVINQSQGDNVGAHDGTSLLERGIDNLLGGPGHAMVKSAGNEGARNRHASGTIMAGGSQGVRFSVPNNQTFPVTIDLWYRGADRIDVSASPPGGAGSAVVNPGTTTTPPLALANGNQVFVGSDVNDPANGDNRIFVVLSRGTAATVEAGTWSLTLTGATVTLGQWDAWIQRDSNTVFLPPFVNPARTISVPGTSAEIITTASYVTRGAGSGSRSSFSSLGPTRDGRQAPTVAAPGQVLMAPQPASTGDVYGLMQGTSMATPVVAGTVALLLQKQPKLTQAEIRDCLTRTARSDAFTGPTPNNGWGAGKLDARAAFDCVTVTVPTLAPPCPPVTIRPPCPPPTTRPPCPPPTLGPPCPPPTLAPPCPPPTFRPPCPPPTLAPPCPPPTLRPPCPPPTFRPPCPPPTLGPPCPPPTLGPPCGPGITRPTSGRGVETSGGWAPVDPGRGGAPFGWFDPYGWTWAWQQAVAGPDDWEAWDAAAAFAAGAQTGTTEWTWAPDAGGAAADAAAHYQSTGDHGADTRDHGTGDYGTDTRDHGTGDYGTGPRDYDTVTGYWYGNPGY